MIRDSKALDAIATNSLPVFSSFPFLSKKRSGSANAVYTAR